MNILVIEDNEQNLYMVNFLLTGRGHRVATARKGEDGLALALAQGFDIILLDIQLPGMDGYTVARRLRQIQKCQSIPIVAVTSYALSDDQDKAIEAGCDAYITKPIDIAHFCGEVERLAKDASI